MRKNSAMFFYFPDFDTTRVPRGNNKDECNEHEAAYVLQNSAGVHIARMQFTDLSIDLPSLHYRNPIHKCFHVIFEIELS